jgi:hypothetical protein
MLLLLLLLLLLLQRTKDEFPNLLFKVSAHDHTACRNVARFEQVDACLPAEEGEMNVLPCSARFRTHCHNVYL